MQKHLPKLMLILTLAVLTVAFFAFDLGQYLTLDSLKQHRLAFENYYEQNAGLTILIYFLIYVATTALSLIKRQNKSKRANHVCWKLLLKS